MTTAERETVTRRVHAQYLNGVLVPLETIDLPDRAFVSMDLVDMAEPVQVVPATGLEHLGIGRDVTRIFENGSLNYNLLNEEMIVQEYLQKEQKIREQTA